MFDFDGVEVVIVGIGVDQQRRLQFLDMTDRRAAPVLLYIFIDRFPDVKNLVNQVHIPNFIIPKDIVNGFFQLVQPVVQCFKTPIDQFSIRILTSPGVVLGHQRQK